MISKVDKMEFNIPQHKALVILEIGGLGDFIMATPTLKALRKRYPQNPFYLFVAKRTIPLATDFSENVLQHKVQVIPFLTTGNFFIRNIINFLRIKLITLQRPAIVIDLSSIESDAAAKRRATLLKLFRSADIAGRNTNGRGHFFNYSAPETLFSKEHEVQRKFDVVKELSSDAKPDELSLFVSEETIQKIESLRQYSDPTNDTLIGINIGAYRANRRWPIQHFATLMQNLQKSEQCRFVLFGGSSDELYAEKLLEKVDRSRVIAAVGLSFQEVGAWILQCRLFITNDTGLMHFAAALKVPTIALFGPENPFRYKPWGNFPKHIIKYYPEGKTVFSEANYFYENAIQKIEPGIVLEAARAYLETGTFNRAN